MLATILAEVTDPTIGPWIPVVTNLGVSITLVMYLVIYANPKERREWAQTLKDALREQRADHEKWQKDRDESWAKIVGVMSDARFEILKEVRDSLRGNEDKMREVIDMVNDGFEKCMKEMINAGLKEKDKPQRRPT